MYDLSNDSCTSQKPLEESFPAYKIQVFLVVKLALKLVLIDFYSLCLKGLK